MKCFFFPWTVFFSNYAALRDVNTSVKTVCLMGPRNTSHCPKYIYHIHIILCTYLYTYGCPATKAYQAKRPPVNSRNQLPKTLASLHEPPHLSPFNLSYPILHLTGPERPRCTNIYPVVQTARPPGWYHSPKPPMPRTHAVAQDIRPFDRPGTWPYTSAPSNKPKPRRSPVKYLQ